MNITESLTPKSDQLNADDLIAGPMTITVEKVTAGSAEQPVNVHWRGGTGRPYKPSKSMRRVIAAAWGVDADAYSGRSMTLYRDPSVKYAGQDVGGIRISHLSHLDAPMKLALTVTRGKRVPYEVHPLTDLPIDTRDYIAEGNDAAEGGIDTLREWWQTVPKADQAQLKTRLDGEWKRRALNAAE